MVMRDNVESLYYSKQEFDKHEIREERLFKNISSKLEKISSLSNGWNKIFQGINLNEIRSRADLEKIPITRKSDLTFIQSADLPYGGLTIKKPSDFATPLTVFNPEIKVPLPKSKFLHFLHLFMEIYQNR